jgi:hypothetical protein
MASAKSRFQRRGTTSEPTTCRNSLGQRYCFPLLSPRSGPSTPAVGLSVRTRNSRRFDEHASRIIVVTSDHACAAVFQLMRASSPSGSRIFRSSSSTTRSTSSRVTAVTSSGPSVGST